MLGFFCFSLTCTAVLSTKVFRFSSLCFYVCEFPACVFPRFSIISGFFLPVRLLGWERNLLIVFVASTAPQLGKHCGLRDDDHHDEHCDDADDDSRQYSDNDASRCQNSNLV